MRMTYRIGENDSISFDRITISNVRIGDGVTLFDTTTISVNVVGDSLSKGNFRQKAVESMVQFLAIGNRHSNWR